MENPVAFQVHDRQVDAQMRTAAGGNVWAHWEEHEGLIAGLLMVVPVTEEQTWAPVWVKVWPSLRWDPAAVSRLTSDVPTPAPAQPVAPVETPDLAACLSSCDAYTDPDQWYQCISECSDGPTPNDVPLPTPDPCLDSCMAYTTRNEFGQCIAKCLPDVTPLPTKDPIPIRVCHQECDVAFDSCLDNCGNISAPVAAMSCIGTCEATSATCNVNCDW